MHACRYYHDDSLPPEVREVLEEELYSVFHSPDAHSDPQPAGGPAMPDPLRATVRRLAGTVTFHALTTGNPRLAERVSHEAVHWVAHRWAELEEHDPFAAEETTLASAPSELAPLVGRALEQRPELRRLCDAVLRGLPPEPPPPDGRSAGPVDRPSGERSAIEARARVRLLRGAWRQRLESDRTHHRARLLGRALGGYVRELESLVPRLAERQEMVRDLYGSDDPLWDLDSGEWNDLPLDGLEATAAELERHPELVRLALILGRSRTVTERRTRTARVQEVHRRVVGIGKSEITGVTAGDDVTSLLASEAELLARPETEDLFYAKLAHKELLVLDYHRERVSELVVERPVAVTEEVVVGRGPVVLCVDTSGSMLGLPERIAKAIVLALARRLTVDRRRLEVIAFSTGTRSFTMVPDRVNLAALLAFLSGGFHGGTDLRPALEAALGALERDGWRYADVLVVSDFRVPKIADRFASRIRAQGRRGTLFHSLTVADSPVVDPLNLFDTSWLFDLKHGTIAANTLRPL